MCGWHIASGTSPNLANEMQKFDMAKVTGVNENLLQHRFSGTVTRPDRTST